MRRPASPSRGRPRAGGARGTVAGLVGWVLRHRRLLVTAYAVALHCLVYYLLLYSGSCPQARPGPWGRGGNDLSTVLRSMISWFNRRANR